MTTMVSTPSPPPIVWTSPVNSRPSSPLVFVRSQSMPRLARTPPPPPQVSLCPICLEAINLADDVMTLGCRSRSTESTPHQIHCGRCAHEWLASADAVAGIVCPICRDRRSSQLASMAPGGSYRVGGAVQILAWPEDE